MSKYYNGSEEAEDYSLYYWVDNSLDNLIITLNNDAKTKYTNLILEYKIDVGHWRCLDKNVSKIKCTVSMYFEE